MPPTSLTSATDLKLSTSFSPKLSRRRHAHDELAHGFSPRVALLATTLATVVAVGIYASSQYWLKQHPVARDMLNALAALLWGGTATSLITEGLFHRKIRSHSFDDMKCLIQGELDRQRNFNSYGLLGVVPRLNMGELLESIGSEDLLWVLDTYDPATSTWLDALEAALRRGARVRFLLLDASGMLAEMRAMEAFAREFEGKEAVDHFRSGSEHAIRELVSLKQRMTKEAQSIGALLEITSYEDLPCAPMYLVERDGAFAYGYSTYYLREPTSFGFPHLEWGRGDAKVEMGSRLLNYVRQKWAHALDPVFPKGYPLGQWIYTLTFAHQKNPSVYGKFFVYQEGLKLRCDGEAYYKGFKPDRIHRRGLWRSTSVHIDGTRLTINFDMIIQNDHTEASSFSIPPPSHNGGLRALALHYQGKLEFKEARDFDCQLEGDILQKRGVDPMVGNVRAQRLRWAREIPTGETFCSDMHALFTKYALCDSIFEVDQDKATEKSPSAELSVAGDNRRGSP